MGIISELVRVDPLPLELHRLFASEQTANLMIGPLQFQLPWGTIKSQHRRSATAPTRCWQAVTIEAVIGGKQSLWI
jgi:hypothetical protein